MQLICSCNLNPILLKGLISTYIVYDLFIYLDWFLGHHPNGSLRFGARYSLGAIALALPHDYIYSHDKACFSYYHFVYPTSLIHAGSPPLHITDAVEEGCGMRVCLSIRLRGKMFFGRFWVWGCRVRVGLDKACLVFTTMVFYFINYLLRRESPSPVTERSRVG